MFERVNGPTMKSMIGFQSPSALIIVNSYLTHAKISHPTYLTQHSIPRKMQKLKVIVLKKFYPSLLQHILVPSYHRGLFLRVTWSMMMLIATLSKSFGLYRDVPYTPHDLRRI